MAPIEIIRAVNGKAITVRAALQIIRHQKKMRITAESALPPKIAVLSEHIRQELG